MCWIDYARCLNVDRWYQEGHDVNIISDGMNFGQARFLIKVKTKDVCSTVYLLQNVEHILVSLITLIWIYVNLPLYYSDKRKSCFVEVSRPSFDLVTIYTYLQLQALGEEALMT